MLVSILTCLPASYYQRGISFLKIRHPDQLVGFEGLDEVKLADEFLPSCRCQNQLAKSRQVTFQKAAKTLFVVIDG
jgi:hypothetical protein